MSRDPIEKKLDEIHAEVREIKQILDGNGEPSRGMIVRLDRIEQSELRRRWWNRAAIVAAFAAVADLAGRLVKHA